MAEPSKAIPPSRCDFCRDIPPQWRLKNGGIRFAVSTLRITHYGLEAYTDPDRAAAKRVFDAMMTMTKIDIEKIEAARRG
jgi:2-polyprenyl-6-hydroxyphenyl methylase/3-demethylubiquinone-9 3-methyltransferase